jgi:hypothetical protein
VFGDDGSQLGEVDVAFERVFAARVVCFVDDDVVEGGAVEFLVGAGTGKVHVAGDVGARADEAAGEDVLAAAALMDGDDVFVAVVGADGLFEDVEAAGAGVGFVATHQGRPLPVGHRVGAGVGEQVDVDVFGPEQAGIPAGGPECLFAVFTGGGPDRFDHFDPPRFRWVVKHLGSPCLVRDG